MYFPRFMTNISISFHTGIPLKTSICNSYCTMHLYLETLIYLRLDLQFSRCMQCWKGTVRISTCICLLFSLSFYPLSAGKIANY